MNLGYRPQHMPECHGYWNVMNDTYMDCDCIIIELARQENTRLSILYGYKVATPEWAVRITSRVPTEMVVKRRKIGWFNWIPQWFRKARK